MTGASVARIVRPQGRRGEVAAAVLTDFPERLVRLRTAFLWDGTGEPRPTAIRSCRLEPHRNLAIFHFEGSDSIDDARRLVGLDVQVPLADRAPLPPGSYYITDLIGCDVWEAGPNRPLGRVSDVQTIGEQVAGTPLLVVELPEGQLLIPLALDICRELDLGARRIVVVLPEGLSGLNRE
ncbi:MAG TPA: ribosome maturation factor RimM [Candidatus Acidoferrales bacterium]|nr:ribosome maturation factor RimM [Candidatus Acidoferrales bacterium]